MNVAIVGAGLAGRVLAWRLLEQGATVTLIDANPRDFIGTGLVAAAMIAPSTEAVTSEPLVEEIGRCSLNLWSPWLTSLGQAVEQDIDFQKTGTLVVAHKQDQSDWQSFMQHANIKLKPNRYSLLDHEALQQKDPHIAAGFDQAAFFPDEAVLDNQQLYAGLEQYFVHKAVNWLSNTSVQSIENNGRLVGFENVFDTVFDCRGLGAQEDTPALRGVRGEVVRVYAPEVTIRHAVRLMHPRFPIYIAPKPNHHYVIGATQIESQHLSPVTVRSGLELLSALYSVHSGFAEAQILSMDVGCRPAFADNLPRVEIDHKLIKINGLFRHGYLFAPAIVDDVLSLLASKPLRFPQIFSHV